MIIKYNKGDLVGPYNISIVEDLGSIFAKSNSKRKERFGIWVCPKCNNEFRASFNNIRAGTIKGCGCTKKDKPGTVIGNNGVILVETLGSSDSGRGILGLFKCPSCNNNFKNLITKIQTGKIKNCGCIRGGSQQYVKGENIGDYGIILVTDLGTIDPITKLRLAQRYGIFKCPACNNDFKKRFSEVKNNLVKNCPTCSLNKSSINNQTVYKVGELIGPNKLLLIKDLGMEYTSSASKKPIRMAMFKCPLCSDNFKSRISAIKNDGVKSCPPCSYKRAADGRSGHGLTGTKIYKMYRGMLERCYVPEYSSYKHYGARGITVCNEWLNDVNIFHKWVLSNVIEDSLLGTGNGKLSIDRIDNDGNYEPSNCRFVTSSVQNRNRRDREGVFYPSKSATRYYPTLDSLRNIPYSNHSDSLLSELLTNILMGINTAPTVYKLSKAGINNLDLKHILKDLMLHTEGEEYLSIKVEHCLRGGTLTKFYK